jgi:hypothetical protein
MSDKHANKRKESGKTPDDKTAALLDRMVPGKRSRKQVDTLSVCPKEDKELKDNERDDKPYPDYDQHKRFKRYSHTDEKWVDMRDMSMFPADTLQVSHSNGNDDVTIHIPPSMMSDGKVTIVSTTTSPLTTSTTTTSVTFDSSSSSSSSSDK